MYARLGSIARSRGFVVRAVRCRSSSFKPPCLYIIPQRVSYATSLGSHVAMGLLLGSITRSRRRIYSIYLYITFRKFDDANPSPRKSYSFFAIPTTRTLLTNVEFFSLAQTVGILSISTPIDISLSTVLNAINN